MNLEMNAADNNPHAGAQATAGYNAGGASGQGAG
jgi:hypothetical protein